MIRIPNLVIETYRYGVYTIEICKEEDMGDVLWGSYLQRDGFGVKEYMFGVAVEDHTLDEYIDLVANDRSDYIDEYELRYVR